MDCPNINSSLPPLPTECRQVSQIISQAQPTTFEYGMADVTVIPDQYGQKHEFKSAKINCGRATVRALAWNPNMPKLPTIPKSFYRLLTGV